jgi:hypothetical protein
VQFSDLTELHYISPIANVSSILQHGILSNIRANQLAHATIALPEIQERRKNKQIPGARTLHDYANLYFTAHNPMLSYRRRSNDSICVLCIQPNVLYTPGVIIADCNAASDYVRFLPVSSGLTMLDRNRVFAKYWRHPGDPISEWRHKSEKCAEVLVPDSVPSQFIFRAYVANQNALAAFRTIKTHLPVTIHQDLFFY